MRRRHAFLLLTFYLAALPLSFSQSPNHARAVQALDSMPRVQHVSQVAISPDGTRVAYVAGGRLNVTPTAQPQTAATADNPQARDLTWSADSQHLAYLSDSSSDKPAASVILADANGANPQTLATLTGYVSEPQFSPDGKTLSLLFIENLPRIAGPLQPMLPLAGVIDEQIYEQRLTTIDLTSSAHTVKQVTPADMYVYHYDWLPDSTGWAAIAAHGSGDNNWWIARLYLASASTGELRQLYSPKLQIADPRVSPDGSQIALIEGIMSDEGSTGGDVMLVDTRTGAARNVTPKMPASATSLEWTGARTVLFGENIDGESGFATVSSDSAPRQLWKSPEVASADGLIGASCSRDGKVCATIRQSSSMPPELWAGPIGAFKQVTAFNATVKPVWGETKNVHWMNGNQRVQGWLTLPANYDPARKYPLVITVHGGPSAACENQWSARGDGTLSAMGYFVLCPNPRGSYGQGEAFTQANVKDFGGGDYRDIMASVDALAREYPIDTKRLGIHGHSYGGYMTMWAETQSTRFAAAVAGAGLSNWLSYYGQNDIDQWMIPFFGASVYDDPAVYAKSDPMHFVKNVKTPTLILVGDRDGEVPASQSVEWWHALKNFNVPTELVVYENEGHAIGRDPAHRRDYELRTLEWFADWFAKAQ